MADGKVDSLPPADPLKTRAARVTLGLLTRFFIATYFATGTISQGDVSIKRVQSSRK